MSFRRRKEGNAPHTRIYEEGYSVNALGWNCALFLATKHAMNAVEIYMDFFRWITVQYFCYNLLAGNSYFSNFYKKRSSRKLNFCLNGRQWPVNFKEIFQKMELVKNIDF